jgi:TRAP-type C4-dicarboxylate transport system permease small subunit
MGTIDRALGGLTRALRLTGQAVLVFMMVSICYDAIMRYVVAAPTTWSLEVNTFLMIYLALVPAADVLRSRDHLNISFLYSRLDKVGRTISHAIISAVGVAFCAILAWRGGAMAWDAWEFGERMSTTLGTPMVIPYALLPIGFSLLTLQFLLDFIAACRGQAPAREGGGAEAM